MSVRSDIRYSSLNENEQAAVRMWFALGLNVQAAFPTPTPNLHLQWHTLLKGTMKRGHPALHLCYRLEP